MKQYFVYDMSVRPIPLRVLHYSTARHAIISAITNTAGTGRKCLRNDTGPNDRLKNLNNFTSEKTTDIRFRVQSEHETLDVLESNALCCHSVACYRIITTAYNC